MPVASLDGRRRGDRGDPAPLVYARLFAAFPALAALFVRDKLGMVRGNMLQVTLE